MSGVIVNWVTYSSRVSILLRGLIEMKKADNGYENLVVRLPQELKDRIRHLAKARYTSLTSAVIYLMNEALDKVENSER